MLASWPASSELLLALRDFKRKIPVKTCQCEDNILTFAFSSHPANLSGAHTVWTVWCWCCMMFIWWFWCCFDGFQLGIRLDLVEVHFVTGVAFRDNESASCIATPPGPIETMGWKASSRISSDSVSWSHWLMCFKWAGEHYFISTIINLIQVIQFFSKMYYLLYDIDTWNALECHVNKRVLIGFILHPVPTESNRFNMIQ